MITATFEGQDAKLIWNNVATAADSTGAGDVAGSAGMASLQIPPLKDYRVRVLNLDGAERRVEYVTDPTYVYTYEKNFSDGLARTIIFDVAARNVDGRVGPSFRFQASNTAPATPENVALSQKGTGLCVRWDAVSETDLDGYEVHLGTTSGFTPDSSTLVWKGKATHTYLGVASGTWYAKVRAVDMFGYGGTSASATPAGNAPVAFSLPLVPELQSNEWVHVYGNNTITLHAGDWRGRAVRRDLYCLFDVTVANARREVWMEAGSFGAMPQICGDEWNIGGFSGTPMIWGLHEPMLGDVEIYIDGTTGHLMLRSYNWAYGPPHLQIMYTITGYRQLTSNTMTCVEE